MPLVNESFAVPLAYESIQLVSIHHTPERRTRFQYHLSLDLFERYILNGSDTLPSAGGDLLEASAGEP